MFYLDNVEGWLWLRFLVRVCTVVGSGCTNRGAAIFLMGYITLAFGIEMAMRSMRYHRFEPRGKWNVTICIAAVSVLSLLTWMPTVAWPMYNRCFGSLIWFPVRYELIALIILGILIASFLTLAAVISIQLMRTSNVDPNERIAASRMCYYLLMAALIYVSSLWMCESLKLTRWQILVIPVEVQAHRRDFTNTLATSRIAEIALFTSGMVISFFHLFLRVNATRLVISPMSEMTSRNKPKRPRIRFFGPSDLEMNISGPMALQGGRRPESRQGLINVGPEKNRYDFDPGYFERPNRPLTPASIQSQGAIDPTRWPLPPDSEKTGYFGQEKETSGLHRRNKSNYSLFPTRAEDIPRLPPTVYSPKSEERSRLPSLAMRRQARRSSLDNTKSITDVSEAFGFLSKPAPLFGRNHNRNSSAVSCATVQIGLRFSIAPATLAAAKCTRPERQPELSNLSAPPLRREPTDSSGESLGLPIQSPSTHTSSSEALGEAINALKFPEPPKPTLSPAKPSPGKTPAFPTLSSATYLQTQREKILPPTPRADLPAQSSVPPPAAVAHHPAMSGLRMNPVSPQSPSTPYSSSSSGRSSPARPNARSPTMPSPTARIPLGAGTMARSPPGKGWI